jgi:hypothetical protein
MSVCLAPQGANTLDKRCLRTDCTLHTSSLVGVVTTAGAATGRCELNASCAVSRLGTPLSADNCCSDACIQIR